MTFNSDNPYNDLPLLPPGLDLFESIEVYKKLTVARAALAELKGRTPVIPNPLMLVNTLVLQEAKDSSTIENIVTSSDKLYKAFTSANMKVDPHTKEVLRYREAIWNAWNILKNNSEYNKKLLIDIFKTITQKEEEIRDIQVFVGNVFHTTYTPPEPGMVLDKKLENWLNFANAGNGIDPLIKMAILHYQFESIHPFSDGNGRTGRILSVLYLNTSDLLDLPILYLSKYILEYKQEYYRLLKEVTENGNWKEWILYMLDAIYHTSVFTLKKVNAIYELFARTLEKVKTEASDIYSHELVEVIFSQPYCKIALLEEKGLASRNTASKYLNRLEEMGILLKEKEGNESLYRNVELYKILAAS